MKKWNDDIHKAAKSLGELGYPMYVRLKVASAIDTFASAACLVCDYTDASNQAFLVRALVRDWARTHDLFEHEASPTTKQLEFVRDFDLEYGQRRLSFVIAGVSWLYRDVGTAGHPSRQELDAVKERLYEAVAKLEWLSSGRGFAGEVLGGVQACFGEARLREHLRGPPVRHGLLPREPREGARRAERCAADVFRHRAPDLHPGPVPLSDRADG